MGRKLQIASSRPRRTRVAVLVATALAFVVAGCASRAFNRGLQASQLGDWDSAVAFYRQALQDDPDRPDFKIALERATFAAASMHIDRGKRAEADGRLEEALRDYRRALEYDPGNREIAARAATIERTIRDRIEAAQPRPEIEKLRDQARRTSPEPLLSPTSRDPIEFTFTNASIRDVLNFIGTASGINVLYDRDLQDRPISVRLDGVTLEEALQQIMLSNQLFYKVVNERTILVAQDVAQKRNQYEEQVVQTFFLSHADATEMAQMLIGIVRPPGTTVVPQIYPNKTANTISVRGTAPVVQIIERLLQANDKPRAEIVIDVQILEVNRARARQLGINLSAYAIGGVFSPEAAPEADEDAGLAAPPPFNLNTVTRGINTADFYLAIPSAILNFLESDNQTRVLAKPQLRGAEGQEVSLNLGEDVPVPSTTFTPLATGGANANPLTSFNYRQLGVNVQMTPRVTYEGDIILDVTVENSSRGTDINIADQNLPAFNSRKLETRLRLRDGESNLIAGLLREDERRNLRGFPGIIRTPFLRRLLGSDDSAIAQTDIVMLITPRIIRSHELTAQDISPIYVGTQSNMALGGGPPPLIGGGEPEPPVDPAAPVPPVPAPGTPAGVTPPAAPGIQPPQVPPGSGPVPGTTSLPPVTPPVPPPPATTEPAAVPPPGDPVFKPVPTPAEPAAPAPGALPSLFQAPAQITLGLPGEMRVGGGPYTVPVSITGANRLSTVTLTVTYNPAVLRVRAVQEGPVMRQGGIAAAFTQQVDAAAGRVDIAVTRPSDQTGVAGSGIIAALVVEPAAAGEAALSVNGVGSLAGGGTAPLAFPPVNAIVK